MGPQASRGLRGLERTEPGGNMKFWVWRELKAGSLRNLYLVVVQGWRVTVGPSGL